MLQVPLPAPERDAHLDGRSLNFPFFPSPIRNPNAETPAPTISLIDLTSTEVVRGEAVSFTLSYDERKPVGAVAVAGP
jgi:hypothetical protein